MKIKVNYDFTQQELVGIADIFEIADGTELGELLRIVDAKCNVHEHTAEFSCRL